MSDLEPFHAEEPVNHRGPAVPASHTFRRVVLAACFISMLAVSWHFFRMKAPADVMSPPTWFSLERWMLPIEINAANRLPLMRNVWVRDAALSEDGGKIWIAGDRGLLKISTDGGQDWKDAEINWGMPAAYQLAPEPASGKPDVKRASKGVKKAYVPPPPSSRRLEVGGAEADQGILLAAERTSPKPGPAQPVIPVPPKPSQTAPGPLTIPTTAPPAPSVMLDSEQTPSAAQVQPGTPPPPEPATKPETTQKPRTHANPEDVSIRSIAMSGDGLHGWALASWIESGNTEPVSFVLVSHDQGLTWNVDALFNADALAASVIRPGVGDEAWLVLPPLPLLRRENSPQAVWKPLDDRGSLLYVRGDGLSFSPDGHSGWATGKDGEVWHLVSDGDTVSVSESKPSVDGSIRYVQAGKAQADGVAVGTNGTLLTRNGGKEWKTLRDESRNTSLLAFLGESLTTGLGIYPAGDTMEHQLIELREEKITAKRFIPFSPHVAVVSADGTTLLLCQRGGILVKLQAPDWQFHRLTRAYSDVEGDERTASALLEPYVRLPAPAYYPLAALITGVAFALARRKPEQGAVAGPQEETLEMADCFVSDRPLQRHEVDAREDSHRLALGLSRYIRNENTGLPLTIAITGEWGSGKSSIMSLLEADLRINNCLPVFFNAWHHQSEEHILAAMLESIRQNAIPPLWDQKGRGLLFRWRLASARLRSNWRQFLKNAAFTALGGTLVIRNFDYFSQMLDKGDFSDFFGKIFGSISGIGGIAGAGAVLNNAWKAQQALAAFGANPAQLVANASKQASARDLKGLPSLRAQFAREFGEVSGAMSENMRLVIFIDDLDRCKPEQMMTVLENVNFLTTSGQCVIVLGMDEEAVLDCLAKQLEWRGKLDPDFDNWPRQKKHEKPRQWLEKLVQVSVCVPTLNHDKMRQMVERAARPAPAADAPPLSWLGRLASLRSGSLPQLAAIAFAACAAMLAGWHVDLFAPPGAKEAPPPDNRYNFTAQIENTGAEDKPWTLSGTLEPVRGGSFAGNALGMRDNAAPPDQSAPPNVAAGRPAAAGALPALGLASPAEKPHGSPAVMAYEPGKRSLPWEHLLVVPVLIVFLVLAVRLAAELTTRNVKDTQAVVEAFKQWAGPLSITLTTPRAMKGFINKVRFYDMLSKDADSPHAPGPVPADQLVAFGALSYCVPKALEAPGQMSRESLKTLRDYQLPPGCIAAATKVVTTLESKEDTRAKHTLELLRRSWKRRMLPEQASSDETPGVA